MCLILDTNAFGLFFESTNKQHDDFKPALDWVVRGKGKLVYGGNKYKEEMKTASKYLRFFSNLERAGKLVKLDDDRVNLAQYNVESLETCKDFDDPHLIAIVLESNCRIVCTKDSRAMPYLKNQKFFSGAVKKPKIYSSKKNANLLVDQNISEICRPCVKLSKKKISGLI